MADAPPMAILMAKLPVPGQVKTRLTTDGSITIDQAAEVAAAMLECTASRLSVMFEHVALAISPDGAGAEFARLPGCSGLDTLAQGDGDLGDRLGRLWRAVPSNAPVAFFGVDSPDVPPEALAEATAAMAEFDLAIGPTPDGGVWVLGGRRYLPEVLRDVDWGSERVCEQLRGRCAPSFGPARARVARMQGAATSSRRRGAGRSHYP